MSFWIYPKIWGEGGVGSIIDNSQFAVYTTSFAGGFIQYVSDGGTIAGTDPGYISLNTWQHIVITRPSDGDNSNIYVNGVIGGTANQNSGTPAASTNFYIGSNAGGTQDFNGTIDEIMIFNRTLTAAQIKALYNNRNDLILSDETNKSEVWYATVTPNDGEEDGATYASNNITVSNLNTPPYFVQSLTDQNAYVGVNFTYDIDADDKDPGETVTYFDNATQFNISIATGVINWTTPSVAESFVVNITVCDDSGASNNCTSDTFTINVYTLSTIIESTINNSHHTYNVTADIPGIMGSVINLSTISGPIIDTADSNIYNSTIINSTILRCNISDSTVDNTDCTDTEIDPSDIKESDTTGSNIINSHVWYSSATYSRITDSTIDYSDVDNSTVTDATITNSTIKDSNILNDSVITDSIIINSTIDNSTITNSTVTNSTVIDAVIYDAVVINANISDGILYSGNITWGDNNVAGPENLTDIINYAPTAVINASPTSGTDSVTVIFNGTLSTDPNMPGDLNDYLNYTWGFGDTSPYNYSNITSHTYTSSTIATLTVTDKYGRTDSATVDISVASSGTSAPSSSGGGGGGGGSSAGRMSTIQLIDAGIDTCFGVNSGVSFAFDKVLHRITLTTLGDYYVVLSMPTVEGNLLGGGIILYVDQYAKYDLNKDQYYDFDMRLNSVQSGRACFTMRSVHQAVPAPSVPTTTVTEREPEPTRPTPMPRPPKIVTTPGETYTTPVRPSFKIDLKTVTLGLLPVFLIIGMLVWLVMHKRSTAIVEERKDPIEAYISSLMEKGKSIQEVHRELVKRWPKENAYAAELRHIIKEASKKMSLEEIQRNLVKKGWPADMVKSAIMGHFMRDKISKGKPIEHAKAKLLKAGWKEEEIRKHLKKAK